MSENLPKIIENSPLNEGSEKVEKNAGDFVSIEKIEVLSPVDSRLEELSTKFGQELNDCPDYDKVFNLLERYVSVLGLEVTETILLSMNADPMYMDFFGGIKESNTIKNGMEKIPGPDYESLNQVNEVVAKYTVEMIEAVNQIVDVDEAIKSPERTAMKNDVATVYKIAKAMRWETDMSNDTQETLYPEFWTAFHKLETIHQAVGVLNRVTGIRHDLFISDR